MRTVLILLFLNSTLATAQEYPACSIEKSRSVSFRTPDANDSLQISVIGNPCYEARLRIELKSERGDLIYRYESDYMRHTVFKWSDGNLDRAAEKHVESMLLNAVSRSSKLSDSAYVCFRHQDECLYDQNSALPVEKYNQVKTRDVPLFSHPTYHEGGKAFVFDSNANEIIEVLDWGA